MQQQLDQQQQQQQHQYDHFFSGHGQFNSETLEAVLCRPPRGAAGGSCCSGGGGGGGCSDGGKKRTGFGLRQGPARTVDWLLTQSKPAIDRFAADPSSSSNRAAGDTRMSSAERGGDHHMVAVGAAGSGKGDADKARGPRGGRSAPMELGCELGRLVPAPVLGEYYYELAEMMSNNTGGEGDDDGDYDDDGDFLDGMQY
ncbi:hypothetical protein OsJ_29327 [Oryza sativa Japonica Group]|uniref:Uncharacterized protein n=1 Tax=Oryza sativa subsp. japonica TaxID=39947 RepID=B9G3J3_ORYSJ|nr:hypothetical protein OsJ_29327 [Oryza sativa Japonica Group]